LRRRVIVKVSPISPEQQLDFRQFGSLYLEIKKPVQLSNGLVKKSAGVLQESRKIAEQDQQGLKLFSVKISTQKSEKSGESKRKISSY
jgi:hypothetical protein